MRMCRPSGLEQDDRLRISSVFSAALVRLIQSTSVSPPKRGVQTNRDVSHPEGRSIGSFHVSLPVVSLRRAAPYSLSASGVEAAPQGVPVSFAGQRLVRKPAPDKKPKKEYRDDPGGE